jgi:acetyltransferase-like isoleucine patch superfamily enzyme
VSRLIDPLRDLQTNPYRRVLVEGRLLRPRRRRQFHSFGADSIIHRPTFVFRPEKMTVGDDVLIMHSAWLEVGDPALRKDGPVLHIGDHVSMRSHVTISAAVSVIVEDNVLIAAYTSIYDSDHSMGGGANPVWNPPLTAPVRVGAGSWLGERVAVLRGADIGRCCVIGANSVVRGAIPDYSIAVGAPARVVGSTRDAVPGGPLQGGPPAVPSSAA